MVATLPGTSNLSRRKSILRYCRRPSPPRWRVVMRPWLLRPALFLSGSRRLFSGSFAVISSKPGVAMKRRPGLVALYFLTGMTLLDSPEQAFETAFPERHHRFLPVGGAADDAATARSPDLAAHIDRVHGRDLHALRLVLLLEGAGDLRLGGAVRHPEGVATLLIERVGTLRDQRPVDHLDRGAAHDPNISSSCSSAPFAIRSWSWVKRS